MKEPANLLREFLNRIFVLAFPLLIVACREGQETSSHDPNPNSNQADPAAPVLPDPLVILTWDEYFSPEVVAEFSKESGIPVEFVTFQNLDEMDALLRSRPGEFDLLVASGGVVADLIELKMLQPLRPEELGGVDHLDQRFLGQAFDPDNTFSLPYMWGTTLIAYRSDKIGEPAHSWSSLWNSEFRDHVLMLDDGFDVYAAALLSEGKDLNSADILELDRATQRLLDQAETLRARFVDIFEVRDKLLSGDCWISMTYSSDAAVLAEENENIAYFIPEEGAPLWLDSFVIPRESSNSKAAHRFLSYLCRPEVAAANSNELWCASANASAREFLSTEILEDPTLYLGDEVLGRCQFDKQTSPERQQRVNQGLRQVFDKVRKSSSATPLSVLTWSNYMDHEVIRSFESATNSRVHVTEIENSEQLRQEISARTGEYDVVIADEMTLARLQDLRLLAELREAEIDAAKGLPANQMVSPFDPEKRYSIPYLWGLTVLAGRKDRVSELEPSWNLLWHEDLRVALIDEPEDLIWISLLAAGQDPVEATKEEIDEASKRITARFPKFKENMLDVISGLDALEANELDLVITYNGDALSRALKNPDISVIMPREGAPIWIDSIAISRDAPQEALAYQFINFMSRPENSAASANGLAYASPIAGAKELMNPELLATPVLYPEPAMLERCSFVRFPPHLQKYVSQGVLSILRGAEGTNSSNVSESAARLAEVED